MLDRETRLEQCPTNNLRTILPLVGKKAIGQGVFILTDIIILQLSTCQMKNSKLVYKIVMKIPKGRFLTYGQVAKLSGIKKPEGGGDYSS